ncbi:MAG: hypothetical protein AAF830_12330 [Pseudomonadota bacterium]
MTTTAVLAVALASAAHADLKPFANIKNSHQQMARIDTDAANKVFIGGGKSNARDLVGEEFADITGGTNIDFNDKKNRHELPPILAAALTSKKNEAPDLEGVTIVSLTEDSFTISIPGWFGVQNFIEFTGEDAKDAIDSVLSTLGNGNPMVDVKNSASQVTVFDTDLHNSIFVGSSGALEPEAKGLVGGSSLNIAEMEDLFEAHVFGNAVEGVELLGLTDEGFAMRMDGQAATRDTIIFRGQIVTEMMARQDNGWVDTFDPDSEFAIFDVKKETRQTLLSDTHDTEEFKNLVGQSISHDEVLEIFRAIITGNGRRDEDGLDGVELIGLNKTSFAISITNTRTNKGPGVDYVLFTNVHTLDGAADLGFAELEDELIELPEPL